MKEEKRKAVEEGRCNKATNPQGIIEL